jgi:hypothetical protein
MKTLKYIRYLQFLQAKYFKFTLELWIYLISVIFLDRVFRISVGDISKFESVYLLQIFSKISACRLFRQARLTHTFN